MPEAPTVFASKEKTINNRSCRIIRKRRTKVEWKDKKGKGHHVFDYNHVSSSHN